MSNVGEFENKICIAQWGMTFENQEFVNEYIQCYSSELLVIRKSNVWVWIDDYREANIGENKELNNVVFCFLKI